MDNNRHHRYHWARVVDVFQELRHNPFQDRISQVFSSMKDSRMSFEDMLDLCSAFSENCPVEVRAKWAFLLFGKFNENCDIEIGQGKEWPIILQ